MGPDGAHCAEHFLTLGDIQFLTASREYLVAGIGELRHHIVAQLPCRSSDQDSHCFANLDTFITVLLAGPP